MNRANVLMIAVGYMLISGMGNGVQAAIVTYQIEGVIEQSVEPLLVEGASYSGMLSFDRSNLSSSPDFIGGVSYSPATVSITSGALTLTGNDISIAIDDDGSNTGSDWIRIEGSLSGSLNAILRINLSQNAGTLFSSNVFPDPFWTLADFDNAQLLINTSTTNFASLKVFQPVPIPMPFYLLGTALMALFGVQRWHQ